MKTNKNHYYSTKHFYNVAQVAAIFGVEQTTVRDWAKNKELPARKVGKQWFFPVAVIQGKKETILEGGEQ